MFLLLQSRSEMQPSNTSRRLKQAQWRTTATRGQQWKPTSRSTLCSHFWRECYQYRPLQLPLSAFSARTVSSWNRIVRDLAKLLCQLVFLKCSLTLTFDYSMFDVITMLSDTALTEQLLSCQKSKIEFSKSFAVSLLYALCSLLFLIGEWIGLLRPWLDLKKAWPWPRGCLALASSWSGLGLEHSVLKYIPDY